MKEKQYHVTAILRRHMKFTKAGKLVQLRQFQQIRFPDDKFDKDIKL